MRREHHVFHERQLAEWTRNLKCPRDSAMADLVGWQAGYVFTVEADRASSRTQRACDEVEGRALARSVRPDETDDLAFLHFEGHPVDCNESPEALGKLGGDQHFNTHHRVVPGAALGTRRFYDRMP